MVQLRRVGKTIGGSDTAGIGIGVQSLSEDFSGWTLPVIGQRGTQIGSTEEFTDLTAWDDSAKGPLNSGFDDTVDIGIYTPKLALDFGTATGSGEIIHSSIAKADIWMECDFYIRKITFDMNLFSIGLRINTSSNDDGYFAGLDFNASFQPQLTIKKRTSGVLADLVTFSSSSLFTLRDIATWAVDVRYRMIFLAVGSDLEVQLSRQSDGVILAALHANDGTFSNTGTASIIKTRTGGAGHEVRMDTIAFYDLA